MKEQHAAGRDEIRNTPGADLMMVDEVYTKYVDWPLCVTIFFLRMIEEALKVEHSASYVSNRLLVAAGGSLRFGCQHPEPRRIRSRGHPLSEHSGHQ